MRSSGNGCATALRLDDGRTITREMMCIALGDILAGIKQELGTSGFASSKFERAAELLSDFSTCEFQDFLTTAAYADFA